MGYEQSSRFCHRCNTQVLAQRERPNHVLHLLITCFLCGLWIPLWVYAAVRDRPWLCQLCGGPT